MQAIQKSSWPEATGLRAFRDALPVDTGSIYRFFYEANRERIKVRKAEVAIPKLQLILEATFTISSARGFHAMSLRDLCQATGLSMGGMYNYISSKEELAAMITEFVGGFFADINADLLPPEQQTQARLEAMTRAYIYMSELFRPWYFFAYMETKNQPQPRILKAQALENAFIMQMEALIARGTAEGHYRPGESYLTAAAILSLIQDWFVKSWHFKDASIDAEGYADFVIAMANRMLASTAD